MHPNELFRSTLTKLAAVLDRYAIRYHLTGGITAVAYGEPRMTQDVDVVIDGDAALRHRDAFLSAVVLRMAANIGLLDLLEGILAEREEP